jgi:hypothetical protein
MSYNTLVGAQFAISSGFAGSINITGTTNAAPPVFTTASAHSYSTNDEVLVDLGWDDFNGVVVRAGAASGSTFSAPGYDTTDTNFYPSASGTGTVKKISGWTSMGQVLAINPSGGEAAFEEVNPFDRRNGVKIFTGFSAASLEITLGWDRSRADQQAFQTASRTGAKRAIRFIMPGGIYGYAYGTVSASALPQFEKVLKQKVVITLDGQFTTF